MIKKWLRGNTTPKTTFCAAPPRGCFGCSLRGSSKVRALLRAPRRGEVLDGLWSYHGGGAFWKVFGGVRCCCWRKEVGEGAQAGFFVLFSPSAAWPTAPMVFTPPVVLRFTSLGETSTPPSLDCWHGAELSLRWKGRVVCRGEVLLLLLAAGVEPNPGPTLADRLRAVEQQLQRQQQQPRQQPPPQQRPLSAPRVTFARPVGPHPLGRRSGTPRARPFVPLPRSAVASRAGRPQAVSVRVGPATATVALPPRSRSRSPRSSSPRVVAPRAAVPRTQQASHPQVASAPVGAPWPWWTEEDAQLELDALLEQKGGEHARRCIGLLRAAREAIAKLPPPSVSARAAVVGLGEPTGEDADGPDMASQLRALCRGVVVLEHNTCDAFAPEAVGGVPEAGVVVVLCRGFGVVPPIVAGRFSLCRAVAASGAVLPPMAGDTWRRVALLVYVAPLVLVRALPVAVPPPPPPPAPPAPAAGAVAEAGVRAVQPREPRVEERRAAQDHETLMQMKDMLMMLGEAVRRLEGKKVRAAGTSGRSTPETEDSPSEHHPHHFP